ncbi:MAG: divalent-cation tolerance protein CutA [Candidatus Caenarcaniphilales bacterium]|nr:divalent-cation tolerance protein CutA [Candidatus Caenarcaniphilales bacterium]
MSNNFCLIYSTGDSKENLQNIAKTLLGKDLIACSNIYSNVSSIYKWQGQIESSDEFIMILKAKSENFEKISTEIEAMHNYDCPAIIQIPVMNMNENYEKYLNSI